MKKNCRFVNKLQFLFGILLLIMLISCMDEKSDVLNQEAETYYCPMHPEVQQNEPGECEKCNGMKLVLKDSENYLDAVLKPVSSSILSNVKIINPQYKSFSAAVEVFGVLEYDDKEKNNISSIYSGRIEKLHIRYNYQPVKKGDKILEIYSPEVVTAQENLIYLLKTSPDEKFLIEAAKQKLFLLQISKEQINEIEETKIVKHTFSVYSNYEGHIQEMGSEKMQNYQSSPILSLKEGGYVTSGDVLFNVVNSNRIIAILNIKSSDISKVYKGQKAEMVLNNNSNTAIEGEVDFIEPIFNKESKSMKIRVTIHNHNREYKIGSLVKAKILSDSLETLWVPASSVLNLGKIKIVWIWEDGLFIAKKVETGMAHNGWIEIADGLIENNQIASEAHYLTDSEGFVKVNENE